MKKKSLFVLLIIFSMLFSFSLHKIINWYCDNKRTDELIDSTNKIISVKEYDYIDRYNYVDDNSTILSANFSNAINYNQDIVGYIKVNGTNVNYSFVQGNDNQYYLKHSINNTYNSAGWVFLDYRNNINELDQNTIIYAHGRVDGKMFGTLKNTLTPEWFNNKDNHYIKVSTMFNNYVFKIFSTYYIETTSDYLFTNFSSSKAFSKWQEMVKNRSVHDFDYDIKPYTKVITLSTCYSNSEKMVVHGYLIKQEKRY